MKAFIQVAGLFVFLAALLSCENEVDVNAEWEDIAVIWGLLDATEDTNWVRIHRAYLGDEDLRGGAQEPDSIYYPEDEVEVYLERIVSGEVAERIDLEPDRDNRELYDGFFTQEDYRIYRTEENINTDSDYRLVVDKLDGGKPATSTTPIVGNFIIRTPSSIQSLPISTRNGLRITVVSGENARIYQPTIEFHYYAYNTATGDSTLQELRMRMPLRLSQDLSSGNEVTSTLGYESVMNYIGNHVKADGELLYIVNDIEADVEVLAGSEDLNTYMNLNAPLTSVNVNRPDFTNIENGYGLFTSKGKQRSDGHELTERIKDSLMQSNYTRHLRFARYENVGGRNQFCYYDQDRQKVCIDP